MQLLLHLVQIDGQHPADSLLLHGDSVKHVGLLHGAPAVGDDDELGLIAHPPQVPGETHHIVVVQGGLDLVHDAEGGGPHLQDGKVQGDGHKGPLAAGQQRQGLEGLARGLDLDLDAAAQHVLRVFQLQLSLAAPEQLYKNFLEGLVDFRKLLLKNLSHLPGDAGDDVRQLPLGPGHVIPLVGEVGIPLVHPLEFLHRIWVDAPQGGDGPLELRDAPLGAGYRLDLQALGLGRLVGQLVGLPQSIQ